MGIQSEYEAIVKGQKKIYFFFVLCIFLNKVLFNLITTH